MNWKQELINLAPQLFSSFPLALNSLGVISGDQRTQIILACLGSCTTFVRVFGISTNSQQTTTDKGIAIGVITASTHLIPSVLAMYIYYKTLSGGFSIIEKAISFK